ncbi:MAG: cell division protein FtsL [Thioalkalivibrio sp.]|nr:MAG: cell division protein FtsL [Thioalkalivibrio sp.]
MLILQALLAALVFASAIGVVVARHEARQAFIEHQSELQQRDALNLEWTQLQLEQATWATQARIETAARERLEMVRPGPDRIIYVGGGSWVR